MKILLIAIIAFLFFKTSSSFDQVAFIKIGDINSTDETGTSYHKTFYLPRYFRTTWMNAKAICRSYDLEFASADTLEEAKSLINMLEKSSKFVYTTAFIGGMTLSSKSKTDWYWANSGNKVSYNIPWHGTQPNNHEGKEHCMSIGRGTFDKFYFHDYKCTGEELTFICEKVEIF